MSIAHLAPDGGLRQIARRRESLLLDLLAAGVIAGSTLQKL